MSRPVDDNDTPSKVAKLRDKIGDYEVGYYMFMAGSRSKIHVRRKGERRPFCGSIIGTSSGWRIHKANGALAKVQCKRCEAKIHRLLFGIKRNRPGATYFSLGDLRFKVWREGGKRRVLVRRVGKTGAELFSRVVTIPKRRET